jgi:hypothetical protein
MRCKQLENRAARRTAGYNDVEDVVGVLIGPSTLQNIQPGIKQLWQADSAHHAVDDAEPMKLRCPVLAAPCRR